MRYLVVLGRLSLVKWGSSDALASPQLHHVGSPKSLSRKVDGWHNMALNARPLYWTMLCPFLTLSKHVPGYSSEVLWLSGSCWRTPTRNYEEHSEKVVSRLLVKTSIAQWKLHWRDLGEISACVKRSIHNMMEDIKDDHMLPPARSARKS